MGGALLARWIDHGLDPETVTIIDPAPRLVPTGYRGAIVADASAAAHIAPNPEVVVLGIKPQLLPAVAADMRPWLGASPLVFSMLAGVRIAALAQAFPAARIVRMMPNTPARIGKGITALCGAMVLDSDRAVVETLAAAAGKFLWLDDESRFDAVTAVSGSGPAFVFRFIEALAGAGEAAGLDAKTAALLALETVVGAAALADEADTAPALLRQQVTSPNGTTQAGLDVLDGDGALSSLMRATIRAAAERSRALAAAADTAFDAGAVREPVKAD